MKKILGIIFHKHKWHYFPDDLFFKECLICHKLESWNNGLGEWD